MIKNEVSEETKKQYQTIDHEEIKRYPVAHQEQICSPIFRNADRKDMYIEKKTINEHFSKKTINEHFSNKKPSFGRGCSLKKIKDDLYCDSW